jgi:arabinan endo-1,5-alpha-L-arabinosidase
MPDTPAENQLLRPRVHDPAVIRCGRFFYLFSTGPRLPIFRSADLLHWRQTGSIFGAELPAWTETVAPGTKGYWWAPDISFSAGLYRVYYSVSTFGSQRSAIGLAVNKTLDPGQADYRWTDCGPVVESAPGLTDFNAIDADAFTDSDGRQWLIFGSFFGGIKMARLDPATNKLADSNIVHIAARPGTNAIEGACLLRRGDYYYLFVSFDLCCRGIESTYRIMVGRSQCVTGPYFDRDGRDMRQGGGTCLLEGDDDWKGPGHNEVFTDSGLDYIVHHAYDARRGGRPTLFIRPLIWHADAWPAPGAPLQPGQTGIISD